MKYYFTVEVSTEGNTISPIKQAPNETPFQNNISLYKYVIITISI